MVLHRLTKRVKDQNWFAVGIEIMGNLSTMFYRHRKSHPLRTRSAVL